jgi:hypothetical protein
MVRQLCSVIEPAGPVRYTALLVSIFFRSSGERQPTHFPLSSYCVSIGSIRWLFGIMPTGPMSMVVS